MHLSLVAFAERSYWSRLWIVQEIVASAENAVVLCSTQSMAWADLNAAIGIVTTSMIDRTRLEFFGNPYSRLVKLNNAYRETLTENQLDQQQSLEQDALLYAGILLPSEITDVETDRTRKMPSQPLGLSPFLPPISTLAESQTHSTQPQTQQSPTSHCSPSAKTESTPPSGSSPPTVWTPAYSHASPSSAQRHSSPAC